MNNGFIALISVLIIGSLVLVISIGASLRSIDETIMSLDQQESYKAVALTNLCAETALMKLESVLNYNGGESIIVDGEICDILLIAGSGNLNRIVQASSTVSGYTRRVKIEVSEVSPMMQISSWKEVADF